MISCRANSYSHCRFQLSDGSRLPGPFMRGGQTPITGGRITGMARKENSMLAPLRRFRNQKAREEHGLIHFLQINSPELLNIPFTSSPHRLCLTTTEISRRVPPSSNHRDRDRPHHRPPDPRPGLIYTERPHYMNPIFLFYLHSSLSSIVSISPSFAPWPVTHLTPWPPYVVRCRVASTPRP